MAVDYVSIGTKIQFFRILKGVTQEVLGEAVSSSRRYISDLERGERRVSLEKLISIANVLQITADDILADNLTVERPVFYTVCANAFTDCSKEETEILLALLQNAKQILRKYTVSE